MAVKLNNNIINRLISRKKIKTLTEKVSIIAEIYKQTFQNIASVEARRIKNMKSKAKRLT